MNDKSLEFQKKLNKSAETDKKNKLDEQKELEKNPPGADEFISGADDAEESTDDNTSTGKTIILVVSVCTLLLGGILIYDKRKEVV